MDGYLIIAELEGLSIEEAKLTYAERQDLPKSSFCGPDRSYPAHDAEHVRAGLQRLSQFKSKMSAAVRKKILACLLRRAKRFGVEVDMSKFKFSETTEELHNEDLIDWYLESLGICTSCQ